MVRNTRRHVSGLGVIAWKRQALETEERELVPIAALEHDLIGDDVEEAAPAKAQRIPPLQNCPLALFENALRNAHHLGGREAGCKHLADRGLPAYRRLCDLVVYSILGVERSQCVRVRTIERFHPQSHELARFHGRLTVRRL